MPPSNHPPDQRCDQRKHRALQHGVYQPNPGRFYRDKGRDQGGGGYRKEPNPISTPANKPERREKQESRKPDSKPQSRVAVGFHEMNFNRSIAAQGFKLPLH